MCGGGGGGVRRQYGIISGQAMSASGGEDKKTISYHFWTAPVHQRWWGWGGDYSVIVAHTRTALLSSSGGDGDKCPNVESKCESVECSGGGLMFQRLTLKTLPW